MNVRFCAIALCALACAAFAEENQDSKVLVLGDDTLESAIEEHEFLLVEFYAPWCGHCQALEPEYEEAANILAEADTPVTLAKLDATENEMSAMQFEIEGFPTLKWFVNGSPIEYSGGRTAQEIVEWVEKMTGPPCTELATQEAIDEFKKSADVVVVAAVEAGSDALKQLETAARLVQIPVGLITDAALAEAMPSLSVVKSSGEEEKMELVGEEDEFDSDEIAQFINVNSLPLVSVFSEEAAPQIFGSDIDNHFLYFNHKDADTHEGYMDVLSTVAKDFKGKTLFVYIPGDEDQVMEFFGFSESDLPTAVQVSLDPTQNMASYRLEKEITVENVREHVEAFHAGTLERTIKSEEIPEDNSGPVTVVVGKTFNDIVMDTEKTVFLEVYAPWCGHCKSLAPDYEKLGEHFANEDSVVIAKMDGTANDIDHPEVNVEGFPTLLIFPKGDASDVHTFEGGDRSLESMIAFVSEHAGIEVAEAASGAVEGEKDEL